MKSVLKIVGRVFKVYLSALGIAWAFTGIGNYMYDAHIMYDKHGYHEKLVRGVLDVHVDHALKGMKWFFGIIKEIIADTIEGLF